MSPADCHSPTRGELGMVTRHDNFVTDWSIPIDALKSSIDWTRGVKMMVMLDGYEEDDNDDDGDDDDDDDDDDTHGDMIMMK